VEEYTVQARSNRSNRISYLFFLLLLATAAHAQWDIEDSHTTASLRGVSNTGGGAVWASGTRGTVLRSEDGGYLWQTCSMPPGAEKLDFRGIQAFDENTAIVMSSGTGDLSRIYKTTDGCQTWKLLFTTPEKEGFFDAIYFLDRDNGILFGDPATGFEGNYALRLRITHDGGQTWAPITDPEPHVPGRNLMPVAHEGFFAASNSNATSAGGWLWMGTGRGRIFRRRLYTNPAHKSMAFQAAYCAGAMEAVSKSCGIPWTDWAITDTTPLTAPDPGVASGVFSIHFRNPKEGIAVGGDYTKPNATTFNIAWSQDSGNTWHAPTTPPHGFRSAIAYDAQQKLWITVGPNGTDISSDNGKHWIPLHPSNNDPATADRGWNALSLPFVVGERGKIGRLRTIDTKP
jgi:photosystem II stability/assembly factor-like uncharacterized protein